MVNDIKTGSNQQEVEANRFASSLLMPESMFRPMLAGSPVDFTLISSLAREFLVSKHACANRILDFVKDAYVIITSQGHKITTQKASLAAKVNFKNLHFIPQETAAYAAVANGKNQTSFSESDPAKWLVNAMDTTRLYECTRGSFSSSNNFSMCSEIVFG